VVLGRACRGVVVSAIAAMLLAGCSGAPATIVSLAVPDGTSEEDRQRIDEVIEFRARQVDADSRVEDRDGHLEVSLPSDPLPDAHLRLLAAMGRVEIGMVGSTGTHASAEDCQPGEMRVCVGELELRLNAVAPLGRADQVVPDTSGVSTLLVGYSSQASATTIATLTGEAACHRDAGRGPGMVVLLLDGRPITVATMGEDVVCDVGLSDAQFQVYAPTVGGELVSADLLSAILRSPMPVSLDVTSIQRPDGT
jgi:hypothetical protein